MPVTSGFCAAKLQTLQTGMTLANDTVAPGLAHKLAPRQLSAERGVKLLCSSLTTERPFSGPQGPRQP